MTNKLEFDLHIHSNYSNDAEFEIAEIVEKCINNEISFLSITDHNTISGINEAISKCNVSDINFIPGIEIDCSYNGIDIHLLGYNINWQNADFIELEKSVHKRVMDSFPEMIENLKKIGINVDPEEVLEKSNGKLPCGELIAEVLLTNKAYHSNKKLKPYLKGGERSDMPYINFYLDFFSQGKPAYVKIKYLDFHEAIELVTSNGGTPIIAHPGLNLREREEIVIELLSNGAVGLEVFNNYHTSQQIEYFAELAIQGGYLITCGSDFHGKNKPLIEIGKFRFNENYKKYLRDSILKLHKNL